jgi:hypothetical protein
MTPLPDPRQDQRRQVLAAILVAVSLVLVVGAWAFRSPPAPPMSAVTYHAGDQSAQKSGAPLIPAAWNVTLWQPLTDAPAVTAPSAPFTLSVFSILSQGKDLTAAIDPGDGTGLVYVHVGDTVKGATITAVETTSVTVSSAGAEHRLKLAP